jgi:hypothetical protein
VNGEDCDGIPIRHLPQDLEEELKRLARHYDRLLRAGLSYDSDFWRRARWCSQRGELPERGLRLAYDFWRWHLLRGRHGKLLKEYRRNICNIRNIRKSARSTAYSVLAFSEQWTDQPISSSA